MKRRHAIIALIVGAALGLGLPLLDLALDCRVRTSEGCVWGRAYLPLTIAVGAGIALVLAAVIYGGLRAWTRRRDSGDCPG